MSLPLSPRWEHIAWVSLTVAILCSLLIALDLLRHRQKMWIMNLVWPLTALYAGPLALFAYAKIGRNTDGHQAHSNEGRKPFWQSVALGATHCGSGCTLGDLTAEWITVAAPLTLFGRKMFGSWLVDLAAAYLFGIAFQYFSIRPMRNLSAWQGLWAAVQADTLSLIAWQGGMYGFMALATFVIFDREIPQTNPVFWLVMQVAMLCGFCTAYPMNWWLIERGIKETM